MAMNQPDRSREVSALIALVNSIIEHWKEIARKQFNVTQLTNEEDFEQSWPKILANFFLAETVRIAKALSVLSEGREN
jgi:hypothetical protein